MKEDNKCCYEKCENFGHHFVNVDGKTYHLVCWLLSMNIDLSSITFFNHNGNVIGRVDDNDPVIIDGDE